MKAKHHKTCHSTATMTWWYHRTTVIWQPIARSLATHEYNECMHPMISDTVTHYFQISTFNFSLQIAVHNNHPILTLKSSASVQHFSLIVCQLQCLLSSINVSKLTWFWLNVHPESKPMLLKQNLCKVGLNHSQINNNLIIKHFSLIPGAARVGASTRPCAYWVAAD